jgi:hypothetical protein
MITCQIMTGRRPFWDKIHDIELVCDGLQLLQTRLYDIFKLMKECWLFNPKIDKQLMIYTV